MKAKTPDLPLGLSLGKEGEELFELLAAALGAGEGFELYFVCSANRHVLNEVQRRIESDPIPGVSPSILDYHEAQDLKQLLPDLLAQGHPDQGRYAIGVKADGTEDELAAAWTNALVVLNEQRNRLIAGCPSAIVVLGSPRLVRIAQKQAPDLWSVRSSVFVLPEQVLNLYNQGLYPSPPETTCSRFTADTPDGDYYARLAKALEGSRGVAERISRANLLMRAANAWAVRGCLDRAMGAAKDAELIYTNLGHSFEAIGAFYAQCDLLVHKGETNLALELVVNRLIPAAQALADEYEYSRALALYADVLAAQGYLDDSLRIRELEVLPVFEKLGASGAQAKVLKSIAAIARRQGNFEKARQMLGQARSIFQTLKNVLGESAIAHDLALVNIEEGNYRQARKLLDENLKVMRSMGDLAGEAATWLAIARIEAAESEISQARSNAMRAFEMLREIGLGRGEAAALHELGGLDFVEGKYAEAAENFKKALSVSREIEDRSGEARALAQIALVARECDQLEAAIRLALVSRGLLGVVGEFGQESLTDNLVRMVEELKLDESSVEAVARDAMEQYQLDRCVGLVDSVVDGILRS